MNQQTKIEAATLHGALAKAFAAIEGATKDKTNPAFKSKYADLGSVIDAIKPALIANDLFFAQLTHEATDGVCIETIVAHAGGETMSFGKLFVPASKKDAQGFGSALTYARRYSLMVAFGVPAEDDDGNAAAKSAPANSNGHQAKINADKDAPFPAGPAKNKTALKEMGRGLWADVMSCEDSSALDALLGSQKALVDQLKEALPQWWNGGSRDGEPYEGLGQVIERLQRDFANINETGMDWRGNPLRAG